MTTRRGRLVAAALVLLALAGAVAPAVAGPAHDTAPASERPALDAATQEESVRSQVDPDSVQLTVDVAANGTATWTVEYVVELDTDNRTAAWADLKEDVEANPENYTDRFASRIRETVATAENETGREMAADRFTVSAENRSAGQSFGVLRYTYRWSNFAAVEGDRLVVGDAIAGFYLSDSTRLTILWPAEYEATSVDPAGDESRENGVTWRGSATNFVGDEPRVVATAGGGGAGGVPMTAIVGGLVLAVVLAGVGFYVTRGSDDTPPADDAPGTAAPTASAESPGDPAEGATSAPGDGEGADQPAADDDAASGADDAAAAGAAAASDGEDEEDVPEDLLSNEERVLKLLEDNGGRMKQQEIVDETGWTDAKTSQVLSGMRDEGRVDGFRLGRENVITLPDEDEPGP